ncbi:MAG: bifunctional histidinol-phosphatase/imidazoleglycerol-phosphate dehydratase HisB [Gammaproteobacteria bacterium]|nr:bifunctional histidinol-phosphatase/imidazoleglycerol-phosphate dehydratase HisB [Gammaproteobacteria bacterium]
MQQYNYLFIDRDGTLIVEPEDQQIDAIAKLDFLPGVFSALIQLQRAGYKLVMVTNQDGLGTTAFPETDFQPAHQLMLKLLRSQGIVFDDIKICPHQADEGCRCRKPEVGLLMNYLVTQKINCANSFVIGDRDSDAALADNLGISAIQIGKPGYESWDEIATTILQRPRIAQVTRQTNETAINVSVNLDRTQKVSIDSGINFLNHMLEQLAKHAGISMQLTAQGDLHIDDHHTVEDIAIVLGSAIKQALGDKIGIGRYGFVLPMDESLATVAIDLSNRPCLVFHAELKRQQLGDLATEMVAHFFSSFADGLRAALHITLNGDNTHHMVEAAFKGVGRALRQALQRNSNDLPSTKGVL